MILTLMFAVFSRRLLQSSKFFLSVLVKYFIVSTRECRDKSSFSNVILSRKYFSPSFTQKIRIF